MKQIKINESTYKLISSFTEMTKEQFLTIAKFRMQFIHKEANLVEFNAIRIPTFALLSDVPIEIQNKITAEEWVDILPFVNFALLDVPDFKTNLLSAVKFKDSALYGPTGLMDKCTADEFTRIDTAFVRASNGKDVDGLAQMFAFMYRPQKKNLKEFINSDFWNGDVREEFNAEKCKARIEVIKKLPMEYLIANYLYFSSVRKQRFEVLRYLFQEVESKIHMDDRGWAGSMLQLSHSGVFGDFDRQMKQNWFTVMVEMDRLSEQNIKQNIEK
jgi:hypothetical protein